MGWSVIHLRNNFVQRVFICTYFFASKYEMGWRYHSGRWTGLYCWMGFVRCNLLSEEELNRSTFKSLTSFKFTPILIYLTNQRINDLSKRKNFKRFNDLKFLNALNVLNVWDVLNLVPILQSRASAGFIRDKKFGANTLRAFLHIF